jgi:hypothetical protein
MDNLCTDLLILISIYCEKKCIISSLSVNKKWNNMFSDNNIWKEIGRRDDPILEIGCKEHYARWYVTDEQVYEAIENNNWARNWSKTKILNYNDKEDEIIYAYIFSIMKTMKIITNMSLVKQKVREMDWKIAFSKKIEELLGKSEEERDDMYNHVRYLTGNSYLIEKNKW